MSFSEANEPKILEKAFEDCYFPCLHQRIAARIIGITEDEDRKQALSQNLLNAGWNDTQSTTK